MVISNRLFFRKKNYVIENYFATLVVSATAAVSAATVSTATTVESVFGASCAFLGVQEAKAKARTQNKNTFFITFKNLKNLTC
jgi:hypothetical protein